MKIILVGVSLLSLLIGCSGVSAPAPYGPIPSEGQLQWHDVDFYGMITISLNTYTDVEWGYGNEDLNLFNPYKFNADTMVHQMKEAGMKGVLLVSKHHNGFCLWPTSTTEFSVKNTPWREGEGDMVRELSDACARANMKFGIYVSPWDRNDADYGGPEYLERYRTQIRELHSDYGDLFLSWYDGANGGDGYYGGANEVRKIDKQHYYDWKNTWSIVRELQPKAAIFSDIGLDSRWVGNESGYAGETCWATFTPKGRDDESKPGNGDSRYWEATEGHRNGQYWMPAECDVPLRPGWFYHEQQDNYVRSAANVFNLYFLSVGRGCNLDLGLAPNREGELHPNDVKSMREVGELIRRTFAENIAQKGRIAVSNTRGSSSRYGVKNLVDHDKSTYYASDDSVKNVVIDIKLDAGKPFNIVSISEYIQLGQRIDSVLVEVYEEGKWRTFDKCTSVGSKRLMRKESVTASDVRITVWGAVSPAISEIGLYLEPEQLDKPVFNRSVEGMLSMNGASPTVSIRYTLDGSEPTKKSTTYIQPIYLPNGGVVRAAAFNSEGVKGEVLTVEYGIAKAKFKAVDKSYAAVIDGNVNSVWGSKDGHESIVIDLGESISFSGFVYTPAKDFPIINYELYVSDSPAAFARPVAVGVFDNIVNNPLPQTIRFERAKGRYVKLKPVKVHSDTYKVMEIDLLN